MDVWAVVFNPVVVTLTRKRADKWQKSMLRIPYACLGKGQPICVKAAADGRYSGVSEAMRSSASYWVTSENHTWHAGHDVT